MVYRVRKVRHVAISGKRVGAEKDRKEAFAARCSSAGRVIPHALLSDPRRATWQQATDCCRTGPRERPQILRAPAMDHEPRPFSAKVLIRSTGIRRESFY
jgi:hypothetical protein